MYPEPPDIIHLIDILTVFDSNYNQHTSTKTELNNIQKIYNFLIVSDHFRITYYIYLNITYAVRMVLKYVAKMEVVLEHQINM